MTANTFFDTINFGISETGNVFLVILNFEIIYAYIYYHLSVNT